jgi:trigger factor
LKIDKEFRDDHQVKLTVELDPEPFEKAKRRAARQIARNVKIPGFRPGKAPYGVILRHVGEGHVIEHAVENLIEEQYPKIIEAAEIQPYGPGKLDNVSQLTPPIFEFVVPLKAEVELGDYKSIRIPYEASEITEEDINKSIQQIRKQNAVRENVERPAQKGDFVFMRISGVRTDTEDQADATIIEERFSSSVIQEDENEDEWPFPGFSKELVGLSANDEKTIEHQYPDDYPDETLQGASAEIKVVVTNIQSETLPTVDDELAKTASEFETLEEWKQSLKSNLEEQISTEYADQYDDQIFEEIEAITTMRYPPQIIEREKEDILKGLEYRLSQQGLNMDLYLQVRGLDEEGLDEEITPIAEERVKRGLILMEIAEAENIEADPEKVGVEMDRTLQAISSTMTPNDAKKFAKSDYVPSLASNIVADMLTQRTMEFLRATSKGEPWPSEEEKTEEAGIDSDGSETESAELESDASPEGKAETEENVEEEPVEENEIESPETDELKPQEEILNSEDENDQSASEQTEINRE